MKSYMIRHQQKLIENQIQQNSNDYLLNNYNQHIRLMGFLLSSIGYFFFV